MVYKRSLEKGGGVNKCDWTINNSMLYLFQSQTQSSPRMVDVRSLEEGGAVKKSDWTLWEQAERLSGQSRLPSQ